MHGRDPKSKCDAARPFSQSVTKDLIWTYREVNPQTALQILASVNNIHVVCPAYHVRCFPGRVGAQSKLSAEKEAEVVDRYHAWIPMVNLYVWEGRPSFMMKFGKASVVVSLTRACVPIPMQHGFCEHDRKIAKYAPWG
jgi:hypothetical protein